MEQFIQKYPYNQLFENNADSHFYMKIGGTVYDVTTHYDPKGRQCVLEQFKELLLQREWRQPHNRKGQPKSIYRGAHRVFRMGLCDRLSAPAQ